MPIFTGKTYDRKRQGITKLLSSEYEYSLKTLAGSDWEKDLLIKKVQSKN